MKYFFIVMLTVLSFSLTSCQFSEHIYINEDGSSKMEFTFDGSELMKIGGDKFTKGAGDMDIDSIFTFKEIFDELKDSIAALPKDDRKTLKAIEDFKVHMITNKKDGKFNLDISSEFKDVSEMQNMLIAFSKIIALDGKNKSKDFKDPLESLANKDIDLKFSFDKGIFKRESIVRHEKSNKQQDGLKDMAMIYASSKYKISYHLPRRVKSVSNDKALFSADGKTVIVEYGLMDYFTDPSVLDLEIVLED